MNEFLSFEPDNNSPYLARERNRSQKWYLENIDKAREHTANWHRKKTFETNPKWKRAYGGAPYENRL